jgi:ABC-type nitrate/sulfonate/bicarbonate transport system substrate-binding protein
MRLWLTSIAVLRTSLLALLVFAGLATAPSVAGAQNLDPVSVIGFPGSGSWPIWIAQEKGYFATNGIEVKLTPTPNSVFQLTGMIDGKFDIGMTAFDNVVAYMEGQGEVPIATQPDLFVFMGGVPTMLAVTVSPEIKTYQELKGKTLAVDAITTGYAFVLFDLLKRNGLNPGDYKVERAGGTLARWQGMREGKFAGSLLTTPFDLIAKANGFNILQRAIDVYGHYQESAAATRRSWAATNRKQLVAYIKGYVVAIEWLREPKNKDESIAILRNNLKQLSPELAAATHAALTGPKGLAPRAQLDVEGIRKLLELRNDYGVPKKTLADPARYYDLKYYEEALR